MLRDANTPKLGKNSGKARANRNMPIIVSEIEREVFAPDDPSTPDWKMKNDPTPAEIGASRRRTVATSNLFGIISLLTDQFVVVG